MSLRAVLTLALTLAGMPAMAQVTLSGEAIQGGLLQGRAPAGSTVTFKGKKIAIASGGAFALGFDRNAKPSATLSVRTADGKVITRKIAVKQRKYKIQRINGLPGRKVSPKKRDMKRIIAENKLLGEARRRLSLEALFENGFIWPSRGRISGVYGSQRILNGKPRRPHLGLDIAAPTGTPVVAAADGVVALTHEDMFFTGKTVLIDHGLEVGTTYIHMSAIKVKKGQRVRRGQLIGHIGKTGRSTGPHLHWGLTWRGVRLDPATVVGPMSKKK